ncbi:hypothetical protein WJX73_001461 [Symbiochloris irregularis]|uniref:Isopropylmalate dehydrogenase-like domain-containing protein n=1 Tax=Symbiochloris irregularis TaxID=706552 RepID=A0AAW1PQ30_9CHLO
MLRQACRSLGLGRCQAAASQQARSLITYVPSPGDARPQTITLIPGDGIGPEVSNAVVEVIDALKAPIVWERFDDVSGSDPNGNPVMQVPLQVMESIIRNGVCLKGTLFTPLSKKNTSTQSLNVQLRKQLDLHVNIVHGFSVPGLPTRHDDVNIVVIRENTEGEYSGLEHEVVPDVVESLKVITAEKSRRTAEYAFGFAFLNHREKVTAVHKANIMKMSDGLFLKEFRDVAKRFPTIKAEEMIVDNTCMQLVGKPWQFDVMVTPNLYGNLVANVVAGITGGPGVIPGANVGDGIAIFEQGARHVGRDIAGKGIANPCAALLSAAMLLRHINLPDFSDRLEKAVLAALAEEPAEVKTPDLKGSGTTRSFTDAVKKRL